MASTPKRQPRRRSNAKRDAAIFADSYVGGGTMDNHQLAEKYGLTPAAISNVLARQKKRLRTDEETPEAPNVFLPADSVNANQATFDYKPRLLTQGQRQMLVVKYRKQGASHEQAVAMAGVSDKGGKNAFRVAQTAEPSVTQLVEDGSTSVNDAMKVMLLPADVQNQAAAEVTARRSNKLATSPAVVKYLDTITPVIEDLNQRQSRKS